MNINKIILIAVFFLFGSSVFAQTDQEVSEVWVSTVQLNTQFPNPNVVRPGDSIFVSINGQETFFIAGEDNINHQWAAAVAFLRGNVGNAKSKVEYRINPVAQITQVSNEWALWLLGILAVAAILYFIFRKKKADTTETETSTAIVTTESGTVQEETEVEELLPHQEGPPILAEDEIPSFEEATDEEVHNAVALATGRTFKKNFEIVGPVERGRATGELVVFYDADPENNVEATTKTFTYDDSPAVRATIRFIDSGEVVTLVYDYGCFNVLYTAGSAEFFGTFTTDDGREYPLNKITDDEITEVTALIGNDDEPGQEILPENELVVQAVKKPSNGKVSSTVNKVILEDGDRKMVMMLDNAPANATTSRFISNSWKSMENGEG